MTGGDERAAVHHLLGAIAAGDRRAALGHLEALLVALGRVEAAGIVRGTAAVVTGARVVPVLNAAGERIGPAREVRGG